MQANCNSDSFVMALVGNKIDALDKKARMVDPEQIKQLSIERNMILSETSARTGVGVSELFLNVAQRIAN